MTFILRRSFHVRFHCAFTIKSADRSLCCSSLRHQLEDFDFARAQRFTAGALRQLGREVHRHTSSPACTRRMQSISASRGASLRRNLSRRLEWRGRYLVAVNVVRTMIRAFSSSPTNFFERADAIQLGHSQIEQDHIGVGGAKPTASRPLAASATTTYLLFDR